MSNDNLYYFCKFKTQVSNKKSLIITFEEIDFISVEVFCQKDMPFFNKVKNKT